MDEIKLKPAQAAAQKCKEEKTMGEIMQFPETIEEFMQQYKITDTQQVYTNGTELVPISRMKQWFEAHKQHWIPCSERPPEELEPVNVVWVNHSPEPYYQEMKDVPQKATAVYYREKWYWWSCVCEDLLAEYGTNETDKVDDDIEITHWMPMPELPEAG